MRQFKINEDFLGLKAKRSGDGNSTITKIQIDPDQGDKFVFEIIGEWEWDNFVTAINKLNNFIKSNETDEWDF